VAFAFERVLSELIGVVGIGPSKLLTTSLGLILQVRGTQVAAVNSLLSVPFLTLEAHPPRVDLTSGFAGSPSSVKRLTRRFSSLAFPGYLRVLTRPAVSSAIEANPATKEVRTAESGRDKEEEIRGHL
jgi:hypothetical protein